jgi:hypothetical protein
MNLTKVTLGEEGGAVEAVKLKLGMQIDDAHFRQMLLDTQVLMTNNYTKWQWDKLYELFQGPLMNQKRLDESIKGIRLLPKLFGFYRPSKEKFSRIKKTKVCPMDGEFVELLLMISQMRHMLRLGVLCLLCYLPMRRDGLI